MTEQLQRYIEQHSDPEGDYPHRLWRATHLHTLHGRMVSGHVEGRLLKMLVTMIRPKHILEIGTFTGYSALCMAEGLRSIGDGGIIHTFDVNDELEPFTRQWIDGSGLGNYIDFRIGDAIEQAPQLGVTFDLAFIDGDKRTYLQTYEMVLRCCDKVASSSPTIHYGTAMSSIRPTPKTSRPWAFAASTTPQHRTSVSKKSSFPCAMASR